MERWQGRVAVVTGASAGIGAAIATSLVQHGLTVVGLARRVDRLKELAEKLEGEKGKFHVRQTDVRNENEILSVFSWIEDKLGGVSVLVNNAGLGFSKSLAEEITDNWKNVLEVNVLALSICTREALRSMNNHKIEDGQIINISSLASHHSTPVPGFSMYTASKKAVMAISEGLRRELALSDSLIRVTTICPGIVATEIFRVANVTLPPSVKVLQPSDIAKTVIFCLEMPAYCQINDISLRSAGEDELKILLAAKMMNS